MALQEHALVQADALTPQGLANVCSACARLDAPGRLTLCLLARPGAVEALGPADVAEVAWALGRMQLRAASSGSGQLRAGGSIEAASEDAAPPEDAQAARLDSASLARAAAAVWRRASAVAPLLGWQEVGLIEFGLRSLAQGDVPGGVVPRCMVPTAAAAEAAAAEAAAELVPRLSQATSAALATVKRERAVLDDAAASALLDAAALAWSGVARGSRVLLMNSGSAGHVHARVAAALAASGLHAAHYHRFADAKLPSECPAASAWPSLPEGGARCAAAVLRLPPSRAALDHAVHAAAAALAPGGKLILFGCREEAS